MIELDELERVWELSWQRALNEKASPPNNDGQYDCSHDVSDHGTPQRQVAVNMELFYEGGFTTVGKEAFEYHGGDIGTSCAIHFSGMQ